MIQASYIVERMALEFSGARARPALPAGAFQGEVKSRSVREDRPDSSANPPSGGVVRSERPAPHPKSSTPEDPLTRWRPSMADYLDDPAISSGFLGKVVDDGLSSALWDRAQPQGITTDPRMAKGNLLHAWLEDGHDVHKIAVASPDVKVRRGNKWLRELRKAVARGAASIMLAPERDGLVNAFSSLMEPAEGWDTRAKFEIRRILQHWTPIVAEVSHRWVPFEGCWPCRTREDIVARSPSGVWTAIQIKTTETPLARWWPYSRRYLFRSFAFYRASHIDLFQGEPFEHLLIVGRTVAPFQWSLFSLADYAEELDDLWAGDILPRLEDITATFARGETYGPEERGLLL